MTDSSDNKNEWPWSLLEIQATDNIDEIKKAYALILKRDRIHVDPEKFQALKEARDYAISLTENNPETSFIEFPSDLAPEQDNQNSHDINENEHRLPNEISSKLVVLLNNPWSRSDTKVWKTFFSELPLLTDEQNFFLEANIATTVDDWLDGTTNFPSPEILIFLIDKYNWSAIDSNLPRFLGDLRIKRIQTLLASLN